MPRGEHAAVTAAEEHDVATRRAVAARAAAADERRQRAREERDVGERLLDREVAQPGRRERVARAERERQAVVPVLDERDAPPSAAANSNMAPVAL